MTLLREAIESGTEPLPLDLPPGAIRPEALDTQDSDEGDSLIISNGIPSWGQAESTVAVNDISTGGTGITSYAKGDLIYAIIDNVLARIAIGSTGDILTISSGLPIWSKSLVGDYTLTGDQTIVGSLIVGPDPGGPAKVRIGDDTDAASLTVMRLGGTRPTPTVGDTVHLAMVLANASGAATEFAQLRWRADSITAGLEDGALVFDVMLGGVLAEAAIFDSSEIVLNANKGDRDFKVHTAAGVNSLIVAGDTGRVGIGVTAPTVALDVAGALTTTGLITAGSGLTTGGHLLFSADNTHDIGASGATRPRTIYLGTLVVSPQLQSTIITGTAPLVIASTTLVTNLNADLIDGIHIPNTIANVLTDHNRANHDSLGTGAVVFTDEAQTLTVKTLTTPTIGSFVNAQHSHLNAAGGGTLTVAALTDHNRAAHDALGTGTILYTGEAWTQTALATFSNNIVFSLDNTHDIGASGVTRPRTLYLGTDLIVGNAATIGNGLTVSAGTTDVQALTASGRITADASGPDGIVFAADGTSGNSARAFFMNNTPTGWVIANIGGSLDFRGAAASPGATSGASQMLLTAAVGLRPATASGLTLGTASLPWGAAWMGALTASGQIKNNTSSATLLGHDTPATGNPRLDVVGASTAASVIALSDSIADATNKVGGLVVRHRTIAEEPFVVVWGNATIGNNTVFYGAGGGAWNSATQHVWHTAATPTTVTGTLAADLTGVGASSLWDFRGGIRVRANQALFDVGITFGTDNSVDIGASGASRPRTVYVGTSVLGADGSAAAPTYSFSGGTDTGMYHDATSFFLLFAVNGVARFRADTSNLRVFGGLVFDSGGAANIQNVHATGFINLLSNGDVTIKSQGGSLNRGQWGLGLQVGAPTGGDKGNGTINVAGDIYKNNVAYTSPDYVFELAFLNRAISPVRKGYKLPKSLKEVEQYTRKNYHLPGMDRSVGLFDATGILEEKLEESFLFLFDHEHRLIELEKSMN